MILFTGTLALGLIGHGCFPKQSMYLEKRKLIFSFLNHNTPITFFQSKFEFVSRTCLGIEITKRLLSGRLYDWRNYVQDVALCHRQDT